MRRSAGKIGPLRPAFKSLKVIGTAMDRSTTYDFLLVIHSNYGPISDINGDLGRNSQNFSSLQVI